MRLKNTVALKRPHIHTMMEPIYILSCLLSECSVNGVLTENKRCVCMSVCV